VTLALLFVSAGVPAQAPPQTIRLICLPGVPLPVLIGQAQGFFAKYGIHVVAEKAASAEALRAALGSHAADLAHASVENSVVAATTGGMGTVIVMGGEQSTSELIVQPDIKTVADLRGHIVILDGEDTAYTLLLKTILSRNGLKPGADCEMKVIGLAPQRLAAMREHPEYAATIQKPPTSILSEQAGLRSLGSTEVLSGVGRLQGIGGFVQRSWAHDHSDLLERYIAGFVEAQRWMMDPAHENQVIALTSAESHMTPDIAKQTYEVAMKEGWSPDARFDVAGFGHVLALNRQAETAAAASPDKYYIHLLSRAK
jgi:ABC-type nitrate/sulfonate/bicarbonate transport system substrate-binding protein